MKPIKYLVAFCFLFACGPAELRIGAGQGIPAIKGNQEFSLDNFTCGKPITSQGYTVTTVDKGDDCEFNFDQTVTVIKASDYDQIAEFKVPTNLVQALELEVRKLTFIDAVKGTGLDTDNYVKTMSLSVGGQFLADKSSLSSLPKTVRLEGEALNEIKTKVDARQAATTKVTAQMLVPKTPPPPAKLKLDYEAQPTLVLGAGKIIQL